MFKKIYSILKYYRIKSIFQFLGIPLLGFIKFNPHEFNFLISGLIICGFYLCYSAIVNNYADKLIDKEPNKNPFIIKGITTFKVFIITIFPVILSLIVCYFFQHKNFVLLLALYFISTAYSMQPFRLKRLFIVGTVCNALIFCPTLFLGINIENIDFNNSLQFCVFCSYIVIVMQLFHEIEDLKDDKIHFINTIPVCIGVSSTLIIIRIFLLLIVIHGVYFYIENIFNILELLITVMYISLVFMTILNDRKLDHFNHKFRVKMRVYSMIYGLMFFTCSFISQY